jgi:hypothetical protein
VIRVTKGDTFLTYKTYHFSTLNLKFPALHAKEIFFDDTKKEYAIGARTRREVDVRLNPLFRYILAVNTKPDPITKFLLKDKGFKMRH